MLTRALRVSFSPLQLLRGPAGAIDITLGVAAGLWNPASAFSLLSGSGWGEWLWEGDRIL